MDMIERVAKKLAKINGHENAIQHGEPVWIMYMPDARAAMEEMMEPTERMISSAGGTDIRDAKRSIYTSMIQAALEEK